MNLMLKMTASLARTLRAPIQITHTHTHTLATGPMGGAPALVALNQSSLLQSDFKTMGENGDE